jgi:hypothetical protein
MHDGASHLPGMFDSAFNKVVRLTVASSMRQLDQVLAGHPPGLRIGVKGELEQTGEAWRYEKARHCAYYLKRQARNIMIWRWSYVASEHEANRLRALITSLQGPLDAQRANRIFEHATHRSVSNPRPVGMEFHALDTGPYAAMHLPEIADSKRPATTPAAS